MSWKKEVVQRRYATAMRNEKSNDMECAKSDEAEKVNVKYSTKAGIRDRREEVGRKRQGRRFKKDRKCQAAG